MALVSFELPSRLPPRQICVILTLQHCDCSLQISMYLAMAQTLLSMLNFLAVPLRQALILLQISFPYQILHSYSNLSQSPSSCAYTFKSCGYRFHYWCQRLCGIHLSQGGGSYACLNAFIIHIVYACFLHTRLGALRLNSYCDGSMGSSHVKSSRGVTIKLWTKCVDRGLIKVAGRKICSYRLQLSKDQTLQIQVALQQLARAERYHVASMRITYVSTIIKIISNAIFISRAGKQLGPSDFMFKHQAQGQVLAGDSTLFSDEIQSYHFQPWWRLKDMPPKRMAMERKMSVKLNYCCIKRPPVEMKRSKPISQLCCTNLPIPFTLYLSIFILWDLQRPIMFKRFSYSNDVRSLSYQFLHKLLELDAYQGRSVSWAAGLSRFAIFISTVLS